MDNFRFIAEASAQGANFSVQSFMFADGCEKQHMAFCYDETDGLTSVMTWDDFSDVCDAFSVDEDGFGGIQNLCPGESIRCGSTVYFKVK